MLQKLFDAMQKAVVSFFNPAGDMSFGRLMTFFIVTNVLAWDGAYVWLSWKMNLAHPELHLALTDMLPNVALMIGQGAFMTLFYGITKYQEYKKDANA